jgi:hypothetical protein
MRVTQKRLFNTAGILAVMLILACSFIPAGDLEAESSKKITGYRPSTYWYVRPGTQRAVYLTGWSMGNEAKREEIYGLLRKTSLNSIVFDVKDDWGYIDYDTDVAMAEEIGADKGYYDLDVLLEEINTKEIYGIARFVVFKDSILPREKPEFAILDSRTGKPLHSEGSYWPDIYCEEVWDYYIEIVKELASKGVEEIQFDYIRAPAGRNLSYAEYSYNIDNNTKVWAITSFLKRVREETKNYNIRISADVFGWIFIAENDQGIGQLLEEIVPFLDFIYPMPYPSHYSTNFLGYGLPEAHPYEVVEYTLKKGISRINEANNSDCIVIPWIQAFGLKVSYTEKEIQDQIKASEDLGIEGYLCWNAANNYRVVERALGNN